MNWFFERSAIQTQYTIFYPYLDIPAALSRKAKGVNCVVKSIGYSCVSSSSSAPVFAHTSISSHWIISLSLSSSPRQSVISSTSHINNTKQVVHSVLKFFLPVNYFLVLWRTSNKYWFSASRPSQFALGYAVQYKWNRTLGVPVEALDILRNDKMLAHAGIQTPDGPFTIPFDTPTTL